MPGEFNFGIVSIKSFGDLVVAHSILQRAANASAHVRIIAGWHLIDLANSLSGNVLITPLPIGNEVYPSLFDIRRRGPLRGICSALAVRRELGRLRRQDQELLVFDRLGFRARFIAGNWPALGLPPNAPNIYQAYLTFFADKSIATTFGTECTFQPVGGRVGMFPTSRVARKNIPVETLNAIFSLLTKARLSPTIFHLNGDPPISSLHEPPKTIDRNFRSLIDAIRSVDYVISADSLPAHLAEYVDRPVFVVSPSPNQYWLPYRCFTNGHWGVFGDSKALGASIGRFLNNPVSG